MSIPPDFTLFILFNKGAVLQGACFFLFLILITRTLYLFVSIKYQHTQCLPVWYTTKRFAADLELKNY